MEIRHFLPCLVLVAAATAVLLVGGVSAGGLATVALVLACPLMMVVMMRSMGGHGDGHSDRDDAEHRQS